MARPKLWIPRIPQIIEKLQESRDVHLSREQVEQLFEIQRSAATDLMKVVGPSSPGYVSRQALLSYLLLSPEGQDADQERQRRLKVARVLNEEAQDQKYRAVVLPVGSLDEWTRFQDLPDITFKEGVMHVNFSTPLDLLEQLHRFVKAVGNEWDQFQRLCGKN